jgi:hypothetical protein
MMMKNILVHKVDYKPNNAISRGYQSKNKRNFLQVLRKNKSTKVPQ